MGYDHVRFVVLPYATVLCVSCWHRLSSYAMCGTVLCGMRYCQRLRDALAANRRKLMNADKADRDNEQRLQKIQVPASSHARRNQIQATAICEAEKY
eukprot:483830-Rhodomonas_salina.2